MNLLFNPAILATAAANFLLHAALLTPPSVLGHSRLTATFLPLIWSCNLYSWQCGLGVFAAIHSLWSTNLLLFHNPRDNFKLIHHGNPVSARLSKNDKNGSYSWKEPYPGSFSERFWWVTKLVASLRYIGWDIGDGKSAALEEGPAGGIERSRSRWLLWKCVSAGICFVVIDAMNSYQRFDTYFLGQTEIDGELPGFLSNVLRGYRLHCFMPRLIRIGLFALQQYSIFSILGSIQGILFVLMGALGLVDDFWGAPCNWPSLMGNPLAIFQSSLRGFWGKFWHQLFRHILLDPGRSIARALNIPDKSIPVYVLQIVVAFFLSGAIHASTLPPDIPGLSPLRYAGFFWIQGICVIIEVLVDYAARRFNKARPVWLRMAFGLARLAWTVGVLYCTVPLIDGELVKVAVRTAIRPVLLFPVPQ